MGRFFFILVVKFIVKRVDNESDSQLPLDRPRKFLKVAFEPRSKGKANDERFMQIRAGVQILVFLAEDAVV